MILCHGQWIPVIESVNDWAKIENHPHFIIKEDTRYPGISFIKRPEANFETLIKCLGSPLYEEVDYSGLVCGTEFYIFYIMDGPDKVGKYTSPEHRDNNLSVNEKAVISLSRSLEFLSITTYRLRKKKFN